jgi:RNA polymerase sigma-70 factor, ECF subfamily
LTVSEVGELLAKIAKQDGMAFQRLYDLFSNRIYRYAFTILHDEHLAEETMQETMIAVWKSADRFAGRSRPSTWMFGIARNQALTLLRKEQRATRGLTPERVEEDPAQRILAEEKVGQALETLSSEHREVLHLTFFEGLSYGEIAAILEIPPGTVKSRMFHAKRRLAEAMT